MATFEENLQRLEQLTGDIKRSDISLEDALKDFEEGIKLAKKSLEANDIVYLFLKDVLGEEKDIAEQEAKEIKMVMKDTTLNKLAKYLHNELGLYSLDCGYDINNEHCIDCIRRKG